MRVLPPFFLMILTAVFLALPVRGQETTDFTFLLQAPNASAAATGNAQVAESRDAFATYWNPAGLAAAAANTAAVSHRIWIADNRTYTVAARLRAGQQGAFGLAITANDSGDLEAREVPGDPNGYFKAQYVSAGVSYGHALGPVRVGATAKYLSERIFENTANGYAFDLAVQTSLLRDNMHLGLGLYHVGQMSKLDREASELPRQLRVGTTLHPFRVLTQFDAITLVDITLLAEVSHIFPTETTQFHGGLGTRVFDMITLQAGYLSNDDINKFTFGLGVQTSGLTFDYAFLPLESGFDGPGHLLTLGYAW